MGRIYKTANPGCCGISAAAFLYNENPTLGVGFKST